LTLSLMAKRAAEGRRQEAIRDAHEAFSRAYLSRRHATPPSTSAHQPHATL